MKFGRSELEQLGFLGFTTIGNLQSSACAEVPRKKGVYVVVRESSKPPTFLEASGGGHFKEEDPTVARAELERNWVEDAYVLYFGKAGGTNKKGEQTKVTLRHRIGLCMQFGLGDPVAHRGGRLIWQLSDYRDLLVAWKPLEAEEPRMVEEQLIGAFVKQYCKLPFANLQR